MTARCRGMEDEAVCSFCRLKGALLCHIEPGQVGLFVISQIPYLGLAFISLGFVGAATGTWWPMAAFVAVGLAFLGPVEMRFLCSHCPHYAREGRWLKCMAPNPFPKLFRPRPGPMKSHERIIIAAFAGSILSFPAFSLAGAIRSLPVQQQGLNPSLLLAAAVLEGALILSAVQFCCHLTRSFCCRCLNLSCPFNRVPATVALEYLKMSGETNDAGEEQSRN